MIRVASLNLGSLSRLTKASQRHTKWLNRDPDIREKFRSKLLSEESSADLPVEPEFASGLERLLAEEADQVILCSQAGELPVPQQKLERDDAYYSISKGGNQAIGTKRVTVTSKIEILRRNEDEGSAHAAIWKISFGGSQGMPDVSRSYAISEPSFAYDEETDTFVDEWQEATVNT